MQLPEHRTLIPIFDELRGERVSASLSRGRR